MIEKRCSFGEREVQQLLPCLVSPHPDHRQAQSTEPDAELEQALVLAVLQADLRLSDQVHLDDFVLSCELDDDFHDGVVRQTRTLEVLGLVRVDHQGLHSEADDRIALVIEQLEPHFAAAVSRVGQRVRQPLVLGDHLFGLVLVLGGREHQQVRRLVQHVGGQLRLLDFRHERVVDVLGVVDFYLGQRRVPGSTWALG